MWNRATPRFHAGAWLLWLLAAMLAALSTRNPFYLAIILLVALLVSATASGEGNPTRDSGGNSETSKRSWGLLLRTLIGLTLFVAVLKGLSLHLGATVLFRMPDQWPVIGGAITLEGMAYTALDALSLLTMLAVFAAFSGGADYYALLRSVPPFMHQVGLVTSIAITFVPQTVTRFAEIREAQALRGHRVRRIGDLLPLIMPLLSGGMERSLNLAEAMEARGFSRANSKRRRTPLLVQGGIVMGLGLVLIGGALFALLPEATWLAWSSLAAGVVLVAFTLWTVGQGTNRSRYRRSVWRDRDTVLLVASMAALATLLAYRFIAPETLVYDPISRLRIYMPTFDPALALSLLSLVAPALITRGTGGKAPGRVATSAHVAGRQTE